MRRASPDRVFYPQDAKIEKSAPRPSRRTWSDFARPQVAAAFAGLCLASLAGIGAAIAIDPEAAPAAQPLALAEPNAQAQSTAPAPTRPAVRQVKLYGYEADCLLVEVRRANDGNGSISRCLRKQ